MNQQQESVETTENIKAVPKQANPWVSFFLIIIFFVIISLTPAKEFLSSITGGAWALAPQNPILMILLFFLSFYPAVAIHELGHWAFGYANGFKPMGLILYPFHWYRTKKGWRWQQLPNTPSGGGMAMMYPSHFTQLRQRLLWFIAGAGITNILIGLICLIIANMLAVGFKGEPTALGHPAFYLAFFGFISIYTGISAFIPKSYQQHGYQGIMSDGKRIQRLWTQQDISSELASVQIDGLIYQGQRPRDWSEQLIAQINPMAISNSIDVVALQYYYYAMLDKSEFKAAKASLERLESHLDFVPEYVRSEILFEATFFAAHHEKDSIRANELFNRAQAIQRFSDTTHQRAEAALHWLENRPAQAHAAFKKIIISLDNRLDIGLAQAERDWLAPLIAEAAFANNKPLEPYTEQSTQSRQTFNLNGIVWLILGGLLLFSIGNAIPFLQTPEIQANDQAFTKVWKSLGYVTTTFLAILITLPFANFITRVSYVLSGVQAGFLFGSLQIIAYFRIFRKNNSFRLGTFVVSGLLGETGALVARDGLDVRKGLQKTLWGTWLTIVLTALIGFGFQWLVESDLWLETIAARLQPLYQPEDPTPLRIVATIFLILLFVPLGLIIIAIGWLCSFFGWHIFHGGWRLAVLSRDGQEAKREAARAMLLGAATNGIRPRDWSTTWLEQVTDGEPLVARDVHMLICAYLAALDHNQIDKARGYLERASAASSLLFFPYNQALQLEQIYYTAWYAKDAVTARQMLKNETNVRNDQASFQRVLAALYFAEGKTLQARKAIAEARATLPKSQHSGVAIAESDWLNQIEAAVLELESISAHQPTLKKQTSSTLH